MFEVSGHGCAAIGTMSVVGEAVIQNIVPVAHNQGRAAARAEGGAALGIVHIAGIDMVQPGL